ncbi:glycosyltransferase family 2 protein [Fredinandcohnia humi]
MNKKVAIVIPVFNRIEETKKCLDCLRKQSYDNFEIIVCDDNSSDGTYEYIVKNYPEVHLVKGNGDLWWTGGTNKAIEYVIEEIKETHYILTLNNDVVIGPNFLEQLMLTAEKNPNALVCATSINSDGSSKILFGGIKKISWITAKYYSMFNNNEVYNKEIHKGHVESACLIGRGMLVPIEVLNNIGLFDYEKLPQYFSDIEYSLRAKKAGFKLIVDLECIVYTESNDNTSRYDKSNNLLFKLRNKKSPLHLRTRLNFAVLCCPKFILPIFIVNDYIRKISKHLILKYSLKRI